MPIVTQAQAYAPHKIYVTHQDKEAVPDLKTIWQNLVKLSSRGGITERDERLLEYLRELNVLSLYQVHRLLFSEAKPRTAYLRLSVLARHRLVGSARIPRNGMTAWGLPVGKVYSLGVGGRLWLKEEVNDEYVARYLKRDQVLHDLLVAEVCVRLVEATLRRGESWSLTWAGERSASFFRHGDDIKPLIAPDGLAIVRQRRPGGKAASLPFFVEVDASRESHGRPSSDWGRKVIGYDQFRGTNDEWKSHPQLGSLPGFPLVAVITHGGQRLLNLAGAINEHRRQQVVYYLALWEDLLAGEDILTVPAWLVVMPDGQILGEAPEQRQPLLAAG